MPKKNRWLRIRITEREDKIFKESAKKRGLTVSDFVRKGAKTFAGMEMNPVPEKTEDWIRGVAARRLAEFFGSKPEIKKTIIELLEPEPSAIEKWKRILEFLGRGR